ncbi:MAG TPA: 3-hydroxyacyl-thioester dehydratase [Micromonosporaceae bacterium]|nr:3-hydroxyacyl-thioester dehydratase [Micromonosporaceae bacterium]
MIDPTAVGAQTEPYEVSWTVRDCLIYALGVGAGIGDLAFTTENTAGVEHRMVPTMPVAFARDVRALKLIGPFDRAKMVHAEQTLTLQAELPVAGRLQAQSRVTGIYDKGRAALVTIETHAYDPLTSAPLFTTGSSLFLGGEGGWGGERGPSAKDERPNREPDMVVRQVTRPDQALLYRLSGDRNRLHSDPALATKAGFERPILHGLCTFGFAGRALLDAVCDGDIGRMTGISGRFSAPVFPGDKLQTSIWLDPDVVRFETFRPDGTAAITNGKVTRRP